MDRSPCQPRSGAGFCASREITIIVTTLGLGITVALPSLAAVLPLDRERIHGKSARKCTCSVIMCWRTRDLGLAEGRLDTDKHDDARQRRFQDPQGIHLCYQSQTHPNFRVSITVSNDLTGQSLSKASNPKSSFSVGVPGILSIRLLTVSAL